MPQLGSLARRARAGCALLAISLCGFASVSACDDAEVSAYCPPLTLECPEVLPSYANEVAPIIAADCGPCHTAEDPQGPWPFDDPGDVRDWSLEILLDLEECLMPPRDADVHLSPADRETVYVWLSCGAPLE